jgi:ABC-type polysaccharide transport system permease subunit
MGILSSDFSYSTAICMLKTFVSIMLLFIANVLSKKVRGYGIV